MIRLKISPSNISPTALRLLVGALKKGQVLVLPTDTIYGLSALATNSSALRKISAFKKRKSNKPFIVLIGDLAMAKRYAQISKIQAKELEEIWGKNQRPSTVILNDRGRLPRCLVSSSGGLALRLPKSDFLIKIVKALGQPLVSTSINLSGHQPVRSIRRLLVDYPDRLHYLGLIIDSGYCRRTRPSRLLDLRETASRNLLRK